MPKKSNATVLLNTQAGSREFQIILAASTAEQNMGMRAFETPVPTNIMMVFPNTQGRIVSGEGMNEPLWVYTLNFRHEPDRKLALAPNQIVRLSMVERTVIETSFQAPIIHMDESLIHIIKQLYREDKA